MTTTAATAAVAGGDAATMTTDDRSRGDEPARPLPGGDETTGGAGRAAAPPKRPSKPSAGWVFAPALGAFFAALTLLAVQVRAGQDPALGPAAPEPVAQTQPKPRRVLVRKVIKRIVVHHPPAASGGSPAPSPAGRTSAPATT